MSLIIYVRERRARRYTRSITARRGKSCLGQGQLKDLFETPSRNYTTRMNTAGPARVVKATGPNKYRTLANRSVTTQKRGTVWQQDRKPLWTRLGGW
jgi:hypothetical protein